MAGGIWTAQNEVRAGAYINFTPTRKNPMTVGDRGIVALPVELPWGKEGALIEVLSEDFANGIARKDIGLTVDSDGTKRIRGALSYAYKGLLYRMNKGGAKASLSLGSLYCEAVYSGELGNRIKIAVIDNENDTYTVITYLDGSVVDSQTVVSLPELSANPYVLFKEYQKFKVTIGGTVATGDTFTVEGVTYTAIEDDTPALVASGLAAALNADSTFTAKYTAVVSNGNDILITQVVAGVGAKPEVSVESTGATITVVDADTEFTPNAGASLTGGTNGTYTESDAYTEFLSLLTTAKYQVAACFSDSATIKGKMQTFIMSQRDDEGIYVQCVVGDYDGADSEGTINSVSGCTINGEDYDKYDFVSIAAGMTAGARLNQSNTARQIIGATKIIGELDSTGIKKALQNGKFLLSASSSGKIKVEQDINSLHTFTAERDKNFSKNRVIRTLDEIGTTVKETWEDTYMGKVDNNTMGRDLFKSDLVEYGNELARTSAIEEFDANDDISVKRGNDVDSVVVDWRIQPIDSMEKLYLTVIVAN